MIELPSSTAVFGWAIGIADTGWTGASAKAQAANPINKSRFMMCLLLGLSRLSRSLIMRRSTLCSVDGTNILRGGAVVSVVDLPQCRQSHRGPGRDHQVAVGLGN